MVPAAARPAEVASFLEQQVAERRVVIRLEVDRLYGTVLDVGEQAGAPTVTRTG